MEMSFDIMTSIIKIFSTLGDWCFKTLCQWQWLSRLAVRRLFQFTSLLSLVSVSANTPQVVSSNQIQPKISKSNSYFRQHDIELPSDLQELPLPHEDHLPGGPALLGHLQLGGDHQDEEERSLSRRWLPSQPVTLPSVAGLIKQTTNRSLLTFADFYVTCSIL